MSIEQLKNVKLITAMVTPFKEDGSINFDALPKLVEHLLAHHTEALLLQGQQQKVRHSPMMKNYNYLKLFKKLSMGVSH